MPRLKLSYIWGVVLLFFLTIVFYKREVSYPAASKRSSIKEANLGLLENGETMADQLAHMRRICQKYRITPNVTDPSDFLIKHPPSPQYSVFYFDTDRSHAYCPIYKSASTSMLYWMLAMHNVDAAKIVKESKRQISDLAREYFPAFDYPIASELLGKSIKWMVLRHPFERLLSAYRDKLENSTAGTEHGTRHFYEKYGRKIVSKYRKQPIDRREPTFTEFVDYIIETNLFLYADDHWIPYFSFCTPCLVDYDVVVKLETFERDVRHLMKLLGEETRPEIKHTTRGGRSHAQLVNSYYKQLDRHQILKLYDKYRLDFELFRYDIGDYLL